MQSLMDVGWEGSLWLRWREGLGKRWYSSFELNNEEKPSMWGYERRTIRQGKEVGILKNKKKAIVAGT